MSTASISHAAESIPRILVDANILVANYRPGHVFKLLLDGARTGQLVLIVPDLAIREAANRYRERCEEERRNLEKALGSLARLGTQIPSLEGIDPAAESLRYDRELRRVLHVSNARVPRIADVAHTHLVERALLRRKPFRANGAGYRDALLWETVLAEARARSPIVFMTKDGSDFANDGALAPDLVADLGRAGLENTAVELQSDLAAFVRAHVNVNTVAAEAVTRALPRALDGLEHLLRELLYDIDLNRNELRAVVNDPAELAPESMIGERVDVGDAQVVEVHAIAAPRVETAQALSTHEVLANLYLTVDVDLDVEVDVIGRDARDGWPRMASCFTSSSVTLGVDIDATFSGDDLELTEVSIYQVEIL